MMKKHLIATCLIIVFLCIFVLTGCSDYNASTDINPYIPDEDYESVEQIGQIPDELKSIIENNLFCDVTAFEERVLKTEECAADEESRSVTHKIQMMDVYGKKLAEYVCNSDDAYHITTLTATDDGGFLFVLGFEDYAYEQDKWASDNGFASRVIKCDKEGNLQFDIPFENITGTALEYCIEKNGHFYFFGTEETPETRTKGVYSLTDIYMVILDKNGAILKNKCIAGTDYDWLYMAEIYEDGFLLSISSQSNDGDFADSGSDGYPVNWVVTVTDALEITTKKKESGKDFLRNCIGEKNGTKIYTDNSLLKDFDAGTPEAFIDYGDFHLIVSTNITGIYEKTPPEISSWWYYTETVYSGYDDKGNLIFRASVDSSPNYDSRLEAFEK